MSYLLGIDLGTSSVKCILASEAGEVIGLAEREYPIFSPQPEHSEQDPEIWWQMTTAAIQELLTKASKIRRQIKAIGLSGQMHGTVFLNRDHAMVRPAIIWADQRSQVQCQQVYNKFGNKRLAQIAGSGVFPGFMLASLLWVKENEPEVWQQVRHVLFPKDYIRLRLTGEIATDVSDASSGLLVDNRKRTWSDELTSGLSIPDEILPPILNSIEVAGQLRHEVANQLGLIPGIPVVAGASDQATGLLGSGIVSANLLAATIGTGGQLVTLITEPRADNQLRTHTFCHALPAQWYLLGATLSAGLAFRWLRDSVLHESAIGGYDRMTSMAGNVPPGAGGLLFLPYLVGERLATGSTQPKGMYVGLSLHHDQSHLIRACMEGVIFSLRRIVDIFIELGVEPEQIIASGGGTRSELWCQIMADVFQSPVTPLAYQEQSAVGAAILAGLGIGTFDDAPQACRTFVKHEDSVEPQPAIASRYQQGYQHFCQLYSSIPNLIDNS